MACCEFTFSPSVITFTCCISLSRVVAFVLSDHCISKYRINWRQICSSFTLRHTSTRCRRFRVMRSEEPMATVQFSSVPKMKSLVCSRYLSTILIASIFSINPFTPATREQIPRMIILSELLHCLRHKVSGSSQDPQGCLVSK